MSVTLYTPNQTQYHIALDLELEQPSSNPQTPDSLLSEQKIIQVGWVVFQCFPDFKVIHSRTIDINIGVPLSNFIKTLTGITDQQIQNGETLTKSFQLLKEDLKTYNCSRIVKQWGGGDMEWYQQELQDIHPTLEWPFGRSSLNVKHLFQTYCLANGISSSGGLSKSLGKCNLKWLGKGKHNAVTDSLNTAQIFDFLMKRMGNKL